jgi:hypothetical protein
MFIGGSIIKKQKPKPTTAKEEEEGNATLEANPPIVLKRAKKTFEEIQADVTKGQSDIAADDFKNNPTHVNKIRADSALKKAEEDAVKAADPVYKCVFSDAARKEEIIKFGVRLIDMIHFHIPNRQKFRRQLTTKMPTATEITTYAYHPKVTNIQEFVEAVSGFNLDSAFLKIKNWHRAFDWKKKFLLGNEEAIMDEEFYLLLSEMVANEFRKHNDNQVLGVQVAEMQRRSLETFAKIEAFYN